MNADIPAPPDRPPQHPARNQRPSDAPRSPAPPTAREHRPGRPARPDGPNRAAAGRQEPHSGVSAADRVIRWAAVTSVAVVAAIAVVISYRHAYRLVHRYGETGATAYVLPLTIDGLIATCSLVILDCARRNRRPPWHAWALLAAGIAATLGANIAHGIEHGIIGALVAGWPALVAVGSFELATRLLRPGERVVPVTEPTAALTADHPPAEGIGRAEQTLADEGPQDPAVGLAQERFSDLLNEGRLPSLRTIKAELKVGHARAVRIRADLARGPADPV